MHLICFHLATLSMLFGSNSCAVITLYDDTQFNGSSIHIRVNENNGECENVPEEWQKITSSITTGDICIDLYAEMNCKGENHIRLYPGNHYHNDLPVWDFNEELVSLQACDKVINDNNHEREGDTLYIFDAKGQIRPFNAPSCKNLPLSWRNRITSTNTQNRCYNFYSGMNCTGRKLSLGKSDPSHNDFGKWNFANITYSIDPCPKEKEVILPIPTVTPQNVSSTTEPTITSKPEQQEKGSSNDTVILVSISLVVIILLLLLIGGIGVFFIYFRRRTDPSALGAIQFEYLSRKYITNFMQGNPSAFEQVPFESADAIFRAQNMPYDVATYEIPLKYLHIDWQNPLGAGEYGTVSKGKLTSPKYPEPLEVAVKTVKAGADPGYVKALLDELKIMMYLNGTDTNYMKHQNIINLIGACTQNLAKLEPYIVLELCPQGSLLNYLRKQRKKFVNLVHDDRLASSDYSNTHDRKSVYPSQIDTNDLLKWSLGIADGMRFLSSKKVIHGDLAARNVLLDDELNPKITDFGLSRQLYQYTQYVKMQQTPLPWRWLAIESLQDMSFSTKSDVWAYGVTLYEIFTLGETPYPGIMFSPQFLSNLKDGYRMSIPKYAPTVLYTLMMKCWEEILDERPSFSDIRQEIFNVLEQSTHQIYYLTVDE